MKTKRIPKITAAVLGILTALAAMFAFFVRPETASAAGAYDFEVTHYELTYDVSANASMRVTELITIYYKGYASTGFLRDIPVNGGVHVRDVDVKKIFDGKPQKVPYDVYSEDSDFLTLDIGDTSNKTNLSETYRITYLYAITNSAVNKGHLDINAPGHGWECSLESVNVTIKLPQKGYRSVKCIIGPAGSRTEYDNVNETQTDSKVVITAQVDRLSAFNGLTFNIDYEKGAIKSYFDATPIIFVVVGIIILAVLILLRLFVFNKSDITPVVNFEAPDKMDPLLMGKLIDNRVNSEDVTSLIYYFADKGYLHINLENENDPVLIKTVKELPSTCSEQERIMFNGLFGKNEMVKSSELECKFYRTVERVTACVNKQAKGLYTSTSFGIAILFALLGGLLLAAAPILLIFLRVSSKFFTIVPFIAIAPALGLYAFSEFVKFNELKYNGKKKALMTLATVGIATAITLLYALLVPSYVIGIPLKFAIGATGCAISALAAILITRTEKYKRQLGDIVGFKNFILLAEKSRLEKLLEDDPQFYYHVLPYAQVLGVSDKWQEKFSGLTVQPPAWATSSRMSLLEFHMINHCLRSSMSRMTAHMVSRPSSSGANGGGHSFGGGRGFGGGGFGGGGGRGR